MTREELHETIRTYRELHETIRMYRSGFDDGFHLGERREGDDFDTSHPAYKAGYDHGVSVYCETIEGEDA